MHKLDRATMTPPACLSSYHHLTHKWDDLTPTDKRTLRNALVQIHGQPDVTLPGVNEYGLRCAYCEGAIRHDGHIEHFRRKNPDHFPELTFDWDNLFLACGSHEHCGHYKDRRNAPVYNPEQLIKPDIHDPEQYLYFHSTGTVAPRTDLSQQDRGRATETIGVLGLNSPVLVGARSKVLSAYKKRILDDLNELSVWPEADRNDYFINEIEATSGDPYATTIKHFLQKQDA